MRHKISRLRLGMKPDRARLFIRNLATSIILYEGVRTTKKRAEVVRPVVERLISRAKGRAPYLAIRAINKVVTDENACRKILEVLVQRYADRTSGFTRMQAAGSRKGDGAMLVDVSLIAGPAVASVAEKPAKTAKAKTPKKTSSKKA